MGPALRTDTRAPRVAGSLDHWPSVFGTIVTVRFCVARARSSARMIELRIDEPDGDESVRFGRNEVTMRGGEDELPPEEPPPEDWLLELLDEPLRLRWAAASMRIIALERLDPALGLEEAPADPPKLLSAPPDPPPEGGGG